MAADKRPGRSELARQYATYMLGVLLQKVGAFLLIPLYTSMLSTADYGILELLSNFTGLAALVIALGVPSAINKCYHRDCKSEAERRDLVGTSVTFTLPVVLAIVALAFVVDRPLSAVLFGREDWAPYLRLALVSLAAMQLSAIPFELLRTLGRAEQYVGFSLLQLVVQVAMSVALLTRYQLGVSAVLLANVAGYVAIQAGTSLFLLRHCRLTFSWRHLKNLAAFGLLLAPISACGWVINVSDRFFLQRLASDAEVGLYALGYKFGMLVELVLVLPFQKAWNPYYFSIADRPEGVKVFGTMLTYYLGLIALGVGALSVCGGPLVRIMAHPEFHAAARVIPMIAASYGLSGIVMCLSTGLIVSGKTRIVTLVAVIGGVVNTVMNVALIPSFGMMGAAVATLATFGISAALTAMAVARWYPVPIEAARLVKTVFAAAVLSMAAMAVQVESSLVALVTRMSIFLSFPILLLLFNFFSEQELTAIKAAVAHVASRSLFSRAH